jgi:hypothetical protein
MPLVSLHNLAVHTRAGVDLVWSNLTVGVLDVDPSIAGVLGMDLLTSGWFERVLLGTGPTGYIHEVNFDFRQAGQWEMLLTIREDLDNAVIPEPSGLLLAGLGCGAAGWWLRRRRALG